MKKRVKLEGIKRYLYFQIGKIKVEIGRLDLVPLIADAKKISNAESKRLIGSGAVDITLDVEEIKET